MDEETYKYSKEFILLAKIGIVFFSFMTLLGLYVIIDDEISGEHFHPKLLYIAYVFVFSLGLWGSVKWRRKLKGHLEISSEGISEHCFDEGDVFIPWQDIKKIKYGRLYGGLIVVSSKKGNVHIMNGIEQPEIIEKKLFKYSDAYSKFRDKNRVLKFLEKLGIYT